MDNWDAGNAAFDRLGFDPTGVRSGAVGFGTTSSGRQGDPTGVDQWEKGYGGFDPLLDWGAQALDAQLAKDNAQYNQWLSPQAGTGYAGQAGSVGGDWANVDQWNPQVNAAASKYGVPANLLKSIMKLESGGQMLGRNGAGAIGLMQVVDTYWGNLGYNLYDPAQNVMAGAHVLRQYYDQYKDWATQNGVDPWKAAVYSYYSGSPFNMNAADRVDQGGSGITTATYGDRIWQDFQKLNLMSGGQPGMGYNAGSWSGLSGVFPNGTVPDLGEFAVESTNGFYGYGTQYGMNGTQHTGVDVPMAPGTPYRAPMGGTVMCAGTGVGSGTDGGGCSAFQDTINGGVGRVELLLDNGAVLIFGHSMTSNFQPGQRVNAGDVVGTSGGMVSNHIHLEARVRDSSTASGWRIVDPRTVIGGGSYASGGYSNATVQQPNNWGNAMTNFLTIPGYSWGR